eukprot:gene16519-22746_t
MSRLHKHVVSEDEDDKIAELDALDDGPEYGEEDEDDEERGMDWVQQAEEASQTELRRRPRRAAEEEEEEEEEEEMPSAAAAHLAKRPRRPEVEEEVPPAAAAAGAHQAKRSRQPTDGEPQPTPQPAPPPGQESIQGPSRKSVSFAPEPVEAEPLRVDPQAAAAAEAAAADEVSMALRRIKAHISNASKFAKASPLLRKLLAGEMLKRQQHGSALFEAVRAAFNEPVHCTDLLVHREFMKLIGLVSNRPELFGKAERSHLDTYRILGYIQNEMRTDDNFEFAKALAKVREEADALPDVGPDDEEVYDHLCTAAGGIMSLTGLTLSPWTAPGSAHAGTANKVALLMDQYEERMEEHQQLVRHHKKEWAKYEALQAAAVSKPKEEDVELDPFGLDSLLGGPAKAGKEPPVPPPPPPEPPVLPSSTSAWSVHEVACMKRAAVLECLHTAKTYHKHAWARTGVELLVEHCHEQKQHFVSAHQSQIEDLMTWVRQQRALRKKDRLSHCDRKDSSRRSSDGAGSPAESRNRQAGHVGDIFCEGKSHRILANSSMFLYIEGMRSLPRPNYSRIGNLTGSGIDYQSTAAPKTGQHSVSDDLRDEALSKFFDSSKLSWTCQPTSGGVNNVVNYVNTSDGEKYVMRVYNNGNDSVKPAFEMDLLDKLSKIELSFKTPEPVLSLEGKPTVLLSSGTLAKTTSPEEVGRATGELCNAMTSIETTIGNTKAPMAPYWKLFLAHWATKNDSSIFYNEVETNPRFNECREAIDYLTAEIRKVETQLLVWREMGLPEQLIHGDLHYDNVMVLGDKVSGLLDFEFCVYDWRCMELAVALSKYVGEEEPIPLIRNFVRGFVKHIALSDAEIDLMPDLINLRIFSNVVFFTGRAIAGEDDIDSLTSRAGTYAKRVNSSAGPIFYLMANPLAEPRQGGPPPHSPALAETTSSS